MEEQSDKQRGPMEQENKALAKPKRNRMTEHSTLTEHTVVVYSTHDQAETAVKTLSRAGYEMKNLSIIGQNYTTDEHPVGFINTGERMWTWGKFGAFWGWIWGMLFGSAMVFFPGVGTVLFAGWIVAGLEGALVVGGLAALGGALSTIGVPENSVLKYESELKAGSFLLVAHGNEVDVIRARELLGENNASRIDSYSTKQPAEVY